MRGSDVNRARIGEAIDARRDDQAIFIDRDRLQAAPQAGECFSCQLITRLFHPNAASLFEQNTSRNVERLLGAGDNHHLAGIATDGTGCAQVFANDFTESCRPEWIDIVNCAETWTLAVTRKELRPNGKREMIERRLMDTESAPADRP